MSPVTGRFMKEMLKSLFRKYFPQVRNFVIVGCSVTAFDFVALRVLKEYAQLHYLWAAGIAFVLSTIISYILSMRFVFKGKEGRDRKEEFTVFAVLNCVGLGLTELLMWVFVDKLGLYYMFAKVFVSAAVMFWSFFSRKIFLEQH